MALNNTDIASLLFKSKQGKSSTNNSREFFEEPRDGRPIVFGSQIWTQVGQIPTTAPTLADQATSGVVQYWEDLSLTAVAGTTNSFASDNLKDAIPFNFGDGTYNYGLKSNTDAAIAFGQGDWIVDAETGTLTFYGTTPSNMPPKISFYKYVGSKSDGASPGDFNETIDSTTAADLSDYAPATNKIVFTNSGVTAFQSIVAGSAGDRLLITNSTGAEITVTNEDAGETAANRISTGTGADIAMPDGASFLFNYDGDSDTWRIVGGTGSGGGGSGESDPVDLVTADNRSFSASVGDWEAYADADQATIEDMDAGTANVTITQTNTAPIIGTGMGVFTKDAVDRRGQGIVLQGITIPPALRGLPIMVRFPYTASANFVSGDAHIAAYDETNTEPIGGNGRLENFDSGDLRAGTNMFEGIIYPKSDTASIRVGMHIATENADAYTVNFGDFRTRWEPYIKLPNREFLGEEEWVDNQANATTSVRLFKSGPLLKGKGLILITGAISGAIDITVPSTYTMSQALYTNLSTQRPTVGVGNAVTGSRFRTDIIAKTTTSISPQRIDASTASALYNDVSATAPNTWTNGDYIVFDFEWEVEGWDNFTTSALAINSGLQTEERILSSDVTTNTTMSGLTVNNLRIGSRYEVTGQLYFSTGGTGNSYFVSANHDSDAIAWLGGTLANSAFNYYPVSFEFTATATSLTFSSVSVSGTSAILGNNTKDESYIQVRELPFSQTALVSGTIPLGTETWTDDQTNGTTTVNCYRSGKLFKAKGLMSFTGATSGGEINVTIPTTYAPDTGGVRPLGTFRPKVGDLTMNDGGAPYFGAVCFTSATNLRFYGSNSGSASNITTSNPFTWANGDSITFEMEWEVEGW